MYLPENIKNCIDLLENAGFAAYAVGGCVRDACLGLSPHDYDLCTSALPEQTEEVFRDLRLVLAGEKTETVRSAESIWTLRPEEQIERRWRVLAKKRGIYAV